jgi:NADH:ubiquinone oxidoreductase subunit K
VTQDTATLLVLAACLLGVAVFALVHRRDAFGAVCAVIIGFSAAVTALVAFSISERSLGGAAQLQAFAVLVELIGALCAAVGAALGLVLWRRTGADLVVEPVAARPARPVREPAELEGRTEEGSGAPEEEPESGDDGAETKPDGPDGSEEEDGPATSSQGE